VLDNLHILDYDYYFKMTDALLNQSIWQAFSLYDDILNKGFDGHQFVIGLLGHLRDLLVCKDASTIKLLQVSESVAVKYHEQSQKSSISFLISALSVGSQCDINYKAAKNQRLHVEIFLSKLANITAVLDLSNLGEDEKKKTNPVAIIPEKGTNEVPITEVTPAKSPVTSSQNTEIGKMKLSKLKSTIDLDDLPPSPNAVLAQEVAPVVSENKPFTKAELTSVWTAFTANREALGEISEVVILKRDFNLEGTNIRIKLDNNVQKGLLEGFKTLLMTYLREKLQNTNIQLSAEIAVDEQNFKPYTQTEKFSFMAEKNPYLIDLKNALGLELGY
jgi:DNA polymerase III subunit gamma/tau